MVHSVLVYEYLIRTAEPADVTALRDVFRRSSLSNDGDRANLLAHPDALEFDDTPVSGKRTRVALDDERVIGFATTQIGAHSDFGAHAVELDDLFVDPVWMRRGVALSLVADAVAFARAQRVVRLEVTANPHAMLFYRAAGFIDDGFTETVLGPGRRMHLDVHPTPSPAQPSPAQPSPAQPSPAQQAWARVAPPFGARCAQRTS